MPKIKTNKSATKRFRPTKGGGFKRNCAYTRHLKSCKSSKRRRSLRKAVMVDATDLRAVKEMLPYA